LARSCVAGRQLLPYELLSVREHQVFVRLVEGRSVNRITEELSRAQATVSGYRARIVTKMQLTSNARLVRYAVENNLYW